MLNFKRAWVNRITKLLLQVPLRIPSSIFFNWQAPISYLDNIKIRYT